MNTSLRLDAALLVLAVALGVAAFVWWRSSPAPADLAVRAESPGGAAPRDDARLVAAADELEPALDAVRVSEPERVAFEADGASEPAAAAPAELAALVVEVVWGSDGARAEGVRVEVVPWGAPDPLRATREGTSGPDGRLRLDDLAPGSASLYGDRGGNANVELDPGAETVALFVLPAGTHVEGAVHDEHGVAVAGAQVWLSDYGNWTSGGVVARADASGRFALRDVGDARHLAAHAAGHAPSAAVEVPELVGETVAVELRLGGPGGALEGLVLGPAGEPAQSAEVVLHSADPRRSVGSDGRLRKGAPPRFARTDAAGRFAFAGLAPGDATLAVRCAGAAPHESRVPIEAGRTESATLALVAEAVVAGTARDERGAPIANASVASDEDGDFEQVRTRTAADGSFRLGGLASGEVVVHVDARERGEARATLVLAPGVETRWDPVLARGALAGGTVVDHAGAPLAGWLVAAVESDPGGVWLRRAETDADGSFLLESLPENAAALEVREPDAWSAEPALRIDLARGECDLRLVVPRENRRTARVVGRVSDPRGAPLEGLELVLRRAADGLGESFEPADDGRIAIGPVRPGAYYLELRANGVAPHDTAPFELAETATHDVGAIVLERAGHVRASLRAPDGEEPSVRCTLRDERGRTVAWLRVDGGVARSEPIAPGTYTLVAAGERLAAAPLPLAVVAGGTTEIVIDLARAHRRDVRIALPADAKPGDELVVRVRDASGALVFGAAYAPTWTGDTARVGVQVLESGRYTVEAETSGGLAGSAAFEVDASAASAPAVELELRR